MEQLTTTEHTETVEHLCLRNFRYHLNDCQWNKSKQRSYIDALMSDDNDDKNLAHFSGFTRENDDTKLWIIDGNNRYITLFQYMIGSDRLYWTVGKDKVVYCHHGKLKRGYRLMTDDEYDKFLDTILTWSIIKYVHRQSRKRSRDESDDLSSCGPPSCTLDDDSRF